MKKRISLTILLIPVISFMLMADTSVAQEKASLKKIYNVTDGPITTPFSPAILVNNSLYISGQLALPYMT